MSTVNHQFRLAARPVGVPDRSVWSQTEEPIGEPKDGEVLVKVLYISLDPAMRGWMNDGKSYVPPVAIGAVMRALGAGKVIASKFAGLAVGDYVSGMLGVQEYAVAPGKALNKIDAPADKLPVYLSALGMPGLTAYFGLLEVGKPEAGNTVVVSGAAGAVGSIVGQIARIKGCTVIGIAGGAEKCKYLAEIGFDAAIDYKTENVFEGLRERCPKGIDVYFDNVGGDTLDAALANLALRARVVICGAISQYNSTTGAKGPSNYLSLLVNRASMTGMVVLDYLPRAGEALVPMSQWLKEGKLKSREHIVDGINTFPETLLMLFNGQNEGKLLIKVAGD
jgi:NADPH-dependent curcumin reductase CurA